MFFYSPKEVKKAQEGDEKERPDPPFRYTGGFKNSLFEGFGVLDFGAGDQNLVFEGEFKDGKRHGFGVLRRDGEIVVQGDWQDDKFLEEEKEKEKEASGMQTSGSFADFDKKVKESLEQQKKSKVEVDDSEYVDRMNFTFFENGGFYGISEGQTGVLSMNFTPKWFFLQQMMIQNMKKLQIQSKFALNSSKMASKISNSKLPNLAKKWALPASIAYYSFKNLTI